MLSKKLAKENTKVSDWLNTNIKANIEVSVEVTDNDTEEAMEIEIASECGQHNLVVLEVIEEGYDDRNLEE